MVFVSVPCHLINTIFCLKDGLGIKGWNIFSILLLQTMMKDACELIACSILFSIVDVNDCTIYELWEI